VRTDGDEVANATYTGVSSPEFQGISDREGGTLVMVRASNGRVQGPFRGEFRRVFDAGEIMVVESGTFDVPILR
jgi:hypothetical protein